MQPSFTCVHFLNGELMEFCGGHISLYVMKYTFNCILYKPVKYSKMSFISISVNTKENDLESLFKVTNNIAMKLHVDKLFLCKHLDGIYSQMV